MLTDKPEGGMALMWSLGNIALIQPYFYRPSEYFARYQVEQTEIYPAWLGKLLAHGKFML